MFKTNEGGLDRIIRVIVGLAMLLAWYLMPELSYRWVLLVGVVPLLTGLVGTCPIYSILGVSTCPMKKI